MNDIELEFQALKLFAKSPKLSQRKLASDLGVSLGKVNYIVKALINVGTVKLENFRRSDNKLGYMYIITPKGIRRKAEITRLFFIQKKEEYNKLRIEIDRLRIELNE